MKLPCIRVEQPLGEFYLTSIPSDLLLKVAYSRETKINNGLLSGDQRAIDVKRIKEISKYLNTKDAAIPNTIIISVNFYENDDLEVDPDKKWDLIEENGISYINIPDEKLQLAAIVDGQHRVKGFIDSDVVMDIPCSVYFELPRSVQALVFSTINFNQKKVDKSLAYQLFGYQLDEEKRDYWPPDILAVELSRKMNCKQGGPFYNRIDLIKKKKNGESWTISSAAFIAGVLTLITTNASADRYEIGKRSLLGYNSRSHLQDNNSCPLRSFYLKGNDLAVEMVIERYFDALRKIVWLNKESSDICFRTVGITAQFTFLKEILQKKLVSLDKNLDFNELLSGFSEINFSSEYFSPRTATKRRILDVFRLKLNLIKPDGLETEIVKAAGQ